MYLQGWHSHIFTRFMHRVQRLCKFRPQNLPQCSLQGQSCANPFFRPVASDGKFRDIMKPLLQNASFRLPFAAVVPFTDRKKCLNHTFLVPLRGENENSRRASLNFHMGVSTALG